MLTIEKTVLPSPEQWGIIIDGMRNPMNSWAKSDSYSTHIEDSETQECADFEFFLGDADHSLMTRLANGGPVHAKYRRMIPVYVTINAPLYWWKEFDTYKVGTVCNSCSTMHKIHSKEFTMDDFSCEHLYGICDYPMLLKFNDSQLTFESSPLGCLEIIVGQLNHFRERFLDTKDKFFWWQMIQLLPTSYNQKRTVMLNYEVLVGIYRWRKDHKLDEWHTFCDWIRGLPYADLIVGDTE
jgi:hypothetical protein